MRFTISSKKSANPHCYSICYTFLIIIKKMDQVVFSAILTKKFSKRAFLECFLGILHIMGKSKKIRITLKIPPALFDEYKSEGKTKSFEESIMIEQNRAHCLPVSLFVIFSPAC